MSKQVTPRTKIFELRGVMQNFSRKEKGSKYCKQPHISLTFLTRLMTPQELDELMYGGVYGHIVTIKIEVVLDEQTTKEADGQ